MSLLRKEQLFNVIGSTTTETQSISSSLIVCGSVYTAGTFSGSGAGLTDIPITAITGLSGTSGWLISSDLSTLFTSKSFNVEVTGALSVHGTASDLFLIKNSSTQETMFKIKNNGVAQFYVNATDPVTTADIGQIYFTSSSLYLGLV